jgi:hypothetical protein
VGDGGHLHAGMGAGQRCRGAPPVPPPWPTGGAPCGGGARRRGRRAQVEGKGATEEDWRGAMGVEAGTKVAPVGSGGTRSEEMVWFFLR